VNPDPEHPVLISEQIDVVVARADGAELVCGDLGELALGSKFASAMASSTG